MSGGPETGCARPEGKQGANGNGGSHVECRAKRVTEYGNNNIRGLQVEIKRLQDREHLIEVQNGLIRVRG